MIRLGLIGPGKVGRSIAQALPRDRYILGPILGKGPSSARRLVRDLREGRTAVSAQEFADCDAILIATPESEVAGIVDDLAAADINWVGKCLLHTGRECSPDFSRLVELGCAVAGCYPMQAIHRAKVSLVGVHFLIAGDAPAVRVGRGLVRLIGGHSHVISRRYKAQASIASSVASDVMVGMFEIGVRRLMTAGLSRRRAVEAMQPIVLSTLEDCRRAGGRTTRFPDNEAALRERLAGACDGEDQADGALFRRAVQLAIESLETNDANGNSDSVSPRTR